MRSPRLLSVFLIVPALAIGFAACGGDDSSADEDDITAAIEQAATTDVAENCTEVQTEAFNEQTEFTTDGQATATCEQDAGQGDVAADSVEIENIEVDGDTASADVAFTGGSLGGQTIAISLVDEDGQWKLDSLDEFVEFDKDAFAAGIVEGAAEGGGTPQQVIDCIEQELKSASDEDIQAAYLSGDEDQLVTLFGQCFGQ